jgi:uncharacterized protein YecE (DUF72 family)
MQAIRVGIGGWNFPPWRGSFYPPGLPHSRELAFASQVLTSIEINGTFYGSQKPESFRSWREQTPENFVFSVKGSRFTTHRRDLAEARDSVLRFLESGVLELADKLGPILWQFPPTRQFAEGAMRPFLELLPAMHAGRTLRHVIEARHPSFVDPAWMDLLRDFGVAHAIVESDKHTLVADVTAPFVYARLEHNALDEPEGYASPALDAWAARLQRWADGRPVTDLPCAGAVAKQSPARECFVYFISGDKVRAPDAAQAMLRRLGHS